MTNSIAKMIRAELKTAGIKASQVGVRCSSRTDLNITLTVKAVGAAMSIAELEELVSKFSQVDVCKHSGEVLRGGNVHTRVTVKGGLLKSRVAALEAALEGLTRHAFIGAFEVIASGYTPWAIILPEGDDLFAFDANGIAWHIARATAHYTEEQFAGLFEFVEVQ